MCRLPLCLVLFGSLVGCSDQGSPTMTDYATGRDQSLTHTWHNKDGSRTHRYDHGGNTYYESQSVDSVKLESDLKQAAVEIVVIAAIKAGEAIFDWWNTPTESSNTAVPESKTSYPLVQSVDDGSIASSIGLQSGDVIVAYNKILLDNETHEYDALRTAITNASSSDNVEIVIYRAGTLYKAEVPGNRLLGIRIRSEHISEPWKDAITNR